MKLPLIDYRQFRLSRLNTPQFRHLKLLLFWPIFSLVFCYLENYRPTVYYAPMRCALDHWIPPSASGSSSPTRSGFSFCRRDAALHLIL